MKGKRNPDGLRFSHLILLMIACLLVAVMPAYGDTVQNAVIATAEADYSGGAISIVPVDPDETTGTRGPENELLPQDTSDIRVASYDRYFYLIGRLDSNFVAKFDIDSPYEDDCIWQYSTEGDGDDTNSNPYDMIFVSSEKAYLIRYGSTKAWIVNPSAASEDEFKIGELDLSAYVDGADTDGVPEMAGGVIADGKLFIIMQRLANWAVTELKPYVAVFDIETDAEIDTEKGEGDLKGIPLDGKNPSAIQYLEEDDILYVQTFGAYYGDYQYDGGIISIDPEIYDTEMILDDGDSDNHPYGNISGISILSSDKGYFVGYDGWDSENSLSITTLYSFDPSAESPTGTAVSGLENKSIAGMESGIYTDINGMLWVCNQTDAQVEIVDPSTDTIEESVYTSLNPLNVVFVGYETEDDDSDDTVDDTGDDTGDDDDSGDDDDDDDTCFINTAGNGTGMTMNPLYFILLIGASLVAFLGSRCSRN